MDKLYSVVDLSNLLPHSLLPISKVITPLLYHQRQSLLWCISRESRKLPATKTDQPVQFWSKINATQYQNISTNSITKSPILCSGGILADDMGLGKTLTLLSLIVMNREIEGSEKYDKCTLIIAPLSVLRNWVDQIEHHLAPKSVSIKVYHGTGKKKDVKLLSQFDVVVTTYQVFQLF